jgi:hypothetical protein
LVEKVLAASSRASKDNAVLSPQEPYDCSDLINEESIMFVVMFVNMFAVDI